MREAAATEQQGVGSSAQNGVRALCGSRMCVSTSPAGFVCVHMSTFGVCVELTPLDSTETKPHRHPEEAEQ